MSGKSALKEVDALGQVLGALKDLDDNQRAWVISSAISNLSIQVTGFNPASAGLGGSPTGGGAGSGTPAPIPGQPGTTAHAKAFLRQKQPASVMQQVACLAYYLTNFKSTPHFKAKDIDRMNTEAGGPRIGNPRQALNDATAKGQYLSAAGGGAKQMTAYGEEVVNALPDQTAVKAIPLLRKSRKKAKKA